MLATSLSGSVEVSVKVTEPHPGAPGLTVVVNECVTVTSPVRMGQTAQASAP